MSPTRQLQNILISILIFSPPPFLPPLLFLFLRVMQGQVSDQNAYALGGIAGHAGLFTNVFDVSVLTHRLMYAKDDDDYINSATVQLFTTIKNVTQSSRALGWDTNNYAMNDYRGCGNFSQLTYMHTGYTGTMVSEENMGGGKEREVVLSLCP